MEDESVLPPLSVLDLAIVSQGRSSADALAATTEVARVADQLGYRRIWVAEHHNMATVASTSPAVLLAHLGAVTTRIRLGSGGVMLPNHATLAVAEQFALLEALHPGRIDLGIGRAPGTDQATARALRGVRVGQDEDFPQHLIDLMGLLGDPRREGGMWDHFVATPNAEGFPEIWLLGSSGFSAQLAGVLGLPFAFAHHFDTGGTVEAVELYRQSFQPSERLARPSVLVTASVLCAESDERARFLALPGQLRRLGLRTGRILPLLAPDEAAGHPSRGAAEAMTSTAIVGDPTSVQEGLRELVVRTEADEIMVFTSTYDVDDQMTSLRLLAELRPGGVGATVDHTEMNSPPA
jgi:luciferase family oxidoreductase group 1